MAATTDDADGDHEPWATPGNLSPEVHETHTGMVVLVGARAYKAKKSVTTDFLDFSTVARREQACAREVDLNRRLAPDSYLGIGHFDLPGAAAEPVIVMRRHPDAARLAALVRSGVSVDTELSAIAGMLARFHRTALRGPAIDAEATVAALTERWQENLTELARHTGDVVSDAVLAEVTRLAIGYIRGRGPLYTSRIAERRVVDGHGDLLAQDIFCLPGGPALLDCLEFDDRLRYVDGVDDAAFLAMDLEYLGRGDLGEWFLDEYIRQAGDPAPRSLRDLCVAYRAVVRAKVDCVRVTQGHREAVTDARRHLDIALAHLRSAAVPLVIVGGGPGSGKTTVSRGLAPRIHAQVVSTDDVRRELRASGVISGQPGDLNAGLYTRENMAAVYDEVLRRAGELLGAGVPVIVDGTWRDPRQRERARALAAENSSPTVEFACTLPISEAVHRISTRTATTSDATAGIAAALDDDMAHSWPEAVPVDTSTSVEDAVTAMVRQCRPAG
ncbi:MAG: AAA family ATPase [Actinomycetota bacterium]|nr:AAA family ATPase [Actinomycetota bacterium]